MFASASEQILLYFPALPALLGTFLGVIGMQASAGRVDEPGPKLGHKEQRLRCAHEICLKRWFSNRLRPVQCHWCHPSPQIHFSGRTTEPHHHPTNSHMQNGSAAAGTGIYSGRRSSAFTGFDTLMKRLSRLKLRSILIIIQDLWSKQPECQKLFCRCTKNVSLKVK